MSTILEAAVTTSVEEELETIAKENGGTVRPIDVLNYARDPDTALHDRFTWDDGEAAERYRLWQAREILHVFVRIEAPEDGEERNVRLFVSLPSDRKGDKGYRQLSKVLKNKRLRQELVAMALDELRAFRNNQRYRELDELQPVWDAIDGVL